MAHGDLTFGLYYDFRSLGAEPSAITARWQGILEQVAWAESIGFGSVWVSEHHFLDDDYASSTVTLLAALAARTERMWLGTNVLVLPVHHPLRLAEEALTVDAISGGRLRLGVGLGYRAAGVRAVRHAACATVAGDSKITSWCCAARAAAKPSTTTVRCSVAPRPGARRWSRAVDRGPQHPGDRARRSARRRLRVRARRRRSPSTSPRGARSGSTTAASPSGTSGSLPKTPSARSRRSGPTCSTR